VEEAAVCQGTAMLHAVEGIVKKVMEERCQRDIADKMD
jgi:hypothetical protein